MSPTPAVRLAFFAWFLLLAFAPAAFADDAVRVDLVADEGDRIVVRFRVDGYQSRPVDIDGETYEEIWLPSEPLSLTAGHPALPHVNRSVIVPDDARMRARVIDADFYETFARIVPSKGNLSRTVDPRTVGYEFGPPYRANAFHPGTIATLKPPYILRSHRAAVIQVHPFQYNPVTGVLRVYTDITIELQAEGPGEVNVLQRSGSTEKRSRTFDQLYRSRFLNYGARYRSVDFDEEGEMLIICHDPWIDAMAGFVAHKATMGIDATVVGVSTIGNDPTSIQSYIQGIYDSSDLAFVLLVGDIAEVDSPDVSAGELGASDPSYSKLAGNDDYPDILIGRFSAGTLAQLQTQIERTIYYETLPANQQDWFHRGTGIASAEGAGQGDEGQSDIAHQNEIRSWLFGAGYTEVDQIYDPGAQDDDVAAALNAGRGVVNYTGHGSPTSWGTTGFNVSDVNGLTNAQQLPFIVTVACNNGEFENYNTCFAEAWMRATHNGFPSGAVAIYASTVSQYWAPPMEGQDEFNLLLTDEAEPFHSFGALAFGGSCSMMDDYGASGVDMFNTWIVFGDPSLRVRGEAGPPHGMHVAPATGLSVDGPAGGPLAPESLDYTLQNLGETPIDFAVVASEPWVAVSDPEGSIPGGGSAVVTVGLNELARNLDNGHYTATIELLNLTDHDGDASRTVALSVGVPILQHEWSFDSYPGWTMEGEWQFGRPFGLGGGAIGYPDPASARSGVHVWGVDLKGNYDSGSGGPYHLISDPVDLSGAEGVSLRFQRWLNTEAEPRAHAGVAVSTDGTTWTEVWHNAAGVTDDSWSQQQIDISAVADGEASVSIRWSYGVYAGAIPCSGWNLDDVALLSLPGSVRIDLTVGPTELAWSPVEGASAYDVVRGDLGSLRASGGDFTASTAACVADEVGDTGVGYEASPDPGEGHWFLVRGVGPTGPMTYQSLAGNQVGLRDPEIDAAPTTCP